MATIKIHNTDALSLLRTLPDASVDALVTDPPSGIGFMGKDWDNHTNYEPQTHKGRDVLRVGEILGLAAWEVGFVAFVADIMGECWRVLKPGAHGLVWALPRTADLTALGLRVARFEVRDSLHHIFGSGFPKSLDVSKAIDAAAGVEREVVGVSLSALRGSTSPGMEGAPMVAREVPITAPATPEAHQWDGWGTALKPAHEIWWRVQKPLSPVPHCAIMDDITSDVEVMLWSQFNAKFAEKVSRSSQSDLQGQEFGFAQWLAAALTMASRAEPSERMAMFRSPEVASTALSIALSWSAILDALCSRASMSTTSTASSTTTALKTLRCLTSQITPESTPPREILRSGAWLSVSSAAQGSAVESLNLMHTRITTAQDVATLRALTAARDALASIAESLSVRLPVVTESSVGLTVTAPTGEQSASHEVWWLIRKPLGGTVANNVLEWGTGALNVDGCRVGSDDGRWPPNLLLTHSADCGDDCAPDCPVGEMGRQSGVSVSRDGGVSGSNANPMSWGEQNPSRPRVSPNDTGTAARFFPCFRYEAKPSRSEREAGLDHFAARSGAEAVNREPGSAGMQSPASGAGRRAGAVRNHHPTVKPVALMRWLVRLVTPPGGTVLDPFVGSGTTAVACVHEGVGFVGSEMDPDFARIARARVDYADPAGAVQRRVDDDAEAAPVVTATGQATLF